MEYLYYLSVVIVILMVAILAMRRSYNRDLATNEGNRVLQEKERQAATREHQTARQLSQIPVPWGWPGSTQELRHHEFTKAGGHGSASPLHRWADQLISQKKTVDDDEYQKRKQESFRALLEDRFSSHCTANYIEYRKTRAPMLRDPSEPHDQMDNFPSGRLHKIQSRLSQQPNVRSIAASARTKSQTLSAVKTPWGW